MKFVLVDRIRELEPGKRIVAEKALSLAEEYLADHFPAFPVLPGVLMLEMMTQASAFLVRQTLAEEPGLIVLQEARNVTYKSFLAPGNILTVESVCKEMSPEQSVFAATGRVGERETVKARLTLRHLNLADADPALAATDEANRRHFRELYQRITVAQPARVLSG